MICKYCDEEFTSDYSWQKYCSPKHKNLAGAKIRAARNLTLTERRCYRCKQMKSTEEFGSGGTHTYCKICYNAWQRENAAKQPREAIAARKRRHLERKRAQPGGLDAEHADRRRYRFGLTDEQFSTLLTQQGGGCAICHATEPGGRGTWHIDHDHACCPPYSKGGKAKTCGRCVRGLLCSRCNVGLGNFRHNPQFLIMAVQYLARVQATNEISRT